MNSCVNFGAVVAVFATILSACSERSEAPPAPLPTPAVAEPVSGPGPAQKPPVAAIKPALQTYKIVAEYPHQPDAFTQGLYFWKGDLIESTGQYAKSTVRRTAIDSGDIIELRDVPPEFFAEGITRWKDKLILLTWKSGIGFILDIDTFSLHDTFGYVGQGWGLTNNDTHLIQSDGTHILRFLDPETFKITETLNVKMNGRPLQNINELEWIKGEIWANVWRSDIIARIDPETGNVVGVIDLASLFPRNTRINPDDDVLNGIAFDPDTDRIFVTGKNWPSIFEIEVTGFSTSGE